MADGYLVDDDVIKKIAEFVKSGDKELADNIKALQYIIDNSNRLNYTGQVITNSNSVSGDIKNVIINGNTRYKKSDGTYTDTWESGVSLESVGEKEKNADGKYPIEAVSCGSKNLCLKDKINWTDNHGGGSLNALTPFLEEGKVYTIYGNNDNSSYNLYINILNYNWATKIANGSVPFTFTYSKDMKVIQFLNDTVWTPTSASQLQIKEGENNNSTFEEYKGDKRTVLLDSPLRKIGTIADVLDLDKSQITRKCYKVVLDNNIGGYETNSKNGKKGYHIKLSKKAKDGKLICDKLPVVNEYIVWEETIGIYIKNNEIIIYHNGESLTDFKTWLASNPVTIVYALATPTTEDIQVSPTDNPLTSYTPSTTLTTNNIVKGNISADIPTNVNAIIVNQASEIAKLQNSLLETQALLIDNAIDNA